MHHVLNAVATPRANGQVERLNSVILRALLPSTPEEELWDEQVRNVQFAINNVANNLANCCLDLFPVKVRMFCLQMK